MTKCLAWPWLFKLWIVSIIFTVSYLGFSAMGAKYCSQQFSEGCFVFLGDTLFFYSNVPGVMLSTNAMFKSVLNIESSYRITFFYFFFFWNTIWSSPKWPRTGIWRGHLCSNRGNPAMAHSRSDTVFLPGIVIYLVDRDIQCWNNQALDKSYPYKIPENKVTEKESALGVHLSAWVTGNWLAAMFFFQMIPTECNRNSLTVSAQQTWQTMTD